MKKEKPAEKISMSQEYLAPLLLNWSGLLVPFVYNFYSLANSPFGPVRLFCYGGPALTVRESKASAKLSRVVSCLTLVLIRNSQGKNKQGRYMLSL